jgi:hypothetical protein
MKRTYLNINRRVVRDRKDWIDGDDDDDDRIFTTCFFIPKLELFDFELRRA